MGQFLTIGLATTISINKAEAEKAQLDIEVLQDKMRTKLHYVPEIYTVDDTDGKYRFTLKNDVFSTQLIPLLQEIYPLLYDNSIYYGNILEKLKTTPPLEWIHWAKENPEVAFQYSEFGVPDYISGRFSRKIKVDYDCLVLSMEGKIVMEAFGRQFIFFKYTMMEAFRQFSLAGAIRVSITG